VLPKTNGQAAMKIAHEILNAVRAIHLKSEDGEQPNITVSVGYVTDTVTAIETQDDLIDQADQAMRQAKKQGRDQCVAYVPKESSSRCQSYRDTLL
jgi:diguanylate cyclase (GGDEF)-like protein